MRRVVAWSLALSWLVAAACSSSEEGSSSTALTGSTGAAGASTSSSGAGASGGAGSACDSDSDCAAPTPCTTATCESKVCVVTPLPPETPVFDDAAFGDCKRKLCDANGDVAEIVDETDLPNDYDPCTIDGCSPEGVPVHGAAPEGSPCGPDNDVQCVAGVCTGCNTDNDCPEGGVCHEPFCNERPGPGNDGTCELEIAVGKVVGDADPEDCLHAVCDEDGAIVVAPLADGAFCQGGSFCNPSTCAAGACTIGTKPRAGTATPSQGSGDCQLVVCDGSGGTQSQADDGDTPGDPDPNDCVAPTCSNGSVVNVPAPVFQPCAGGAGVCDGAGNCV